MGSVVVDTSMSLDGFVARLNDDVEQLHEWMFTGDTQVGERSALS